MVLFRYYRICLDIEIRMRNHCTTVSNLGTTLGTFAQHIPITQSTTMYTFVHFKALLCMHRSYHENGENGGRPITTYENNLFIHVRTRQTETLNHFNCMATRTTGRTLTISPRPAYAGGTRACTNAPAANKIAMRL